MMSSLKTLLTQGVKEGAFPGATFCVVSDEKIECQCVGNKSLLPESIINDVNTVYDVASLTKVVVTTTLILKLIEKKYCLLETKVHTILPNFKHKKTTIYELLCHSSGLPADVKASRTMKKKAEVLEAIYGMNLIYEPNTHIVYSDVGFILLGEIIEALYDLPLDEAAKKIIFEPLGMHNSTFRPNKDVCAPTEVREDSVFDGLLQGQVHDEKSFAMQGLSGHAGLFSTAHDLAMFSKKLMQYEHVLAKDTILAMLKPQLELKSLKGTPLIRALGWDKPTKDGIAGSYSDEEKTLIHTGFTGCSMVLDFTQKKALIILSNGVHPKRELNSMHAYRSRCADIVFKGEERKR